MLPKEEGRRAGYYPGVFRLKCHYRRKRHLLTRQDNVV